MKKFKTFYSLLLWVVASTAGADMMQAKAAPTREVPLETFASHLRALEKSRPLSEQEKQLKILTTIGQQALQVESLSVYGGGSDEDAIAKIDLRALSQGILMKIRNQPDWTQTLSPPAQKLIREHRPLIEKTFGAPSYALTWFQLQLGEKDAAKESLFLLFEREFGRVMNLKRAEFGLGQTPLGEAEFIFQALLPLTDPHRQSALKEKMQKMKVHVSNLPQSHVVT